VSVTLAAGARMDTAPASEYAVRAVQGVAEMLTGTGTSGQLSPP
jgi:hypothetical protein